MNPDYKSRSIREWMDGLSRGEYALPDFQRSRVWDARRTARFLKSVLSVQPTGTVLLIESGPGFGRRRIVDNDADISKAEDLILDGQQRLTSLWQSFTGVGEWRYYIEVNDVRSLELGVMDVQQQRKDSRQYRDARAEFDDNLVPVNILYDAPNHDPKEPTSLERWCEDVMPADTRKSSELRRAIDHELKSILDRYKLWYAKLERTGVDEAVKIFVETNRSSVRVKAFDLAVAEAVEIRPGIKLRERIQRFHGKQSRVKHYFSSDKERWIPEIGEFILKIACLKVRDSGMPPKDSNFEKALRHLFSQGAENADEVEADLLVTLQLLEEMGIPNKDILPRVPPVYVVAALQSAIRQVRHVSRAKITRLVDRYLWQSFLSDRYESQANDRLREDYEFLLGDIRRIERGESAREDAPVFRTTMVSKETLQKAVKSRSPVGNAIVALSLNNGSVDWVTGERMTAERVRQLDGEGTLDRHHVYTRNSLIRGGLARSDVRINHPLNIVAIQKLSNISLGSKEPAEYLEGLKRHDRGLTDRALRERVESHLLPYDVVTRRVGPIKDRYAEFLKERAALVWSRIGA